MKRFTITPQSKKTIKVNPLNPTSFPRMSLNGDESTNKEYRNTRDKAYRASCIENIIKFLGDNGYDGPYSQKTLASPSNKDFQSIFKFIYSFIDATPFSKFEEDVMTILKLIKYPYSNEITRSQLAVITPHTWPVVLSMMSWMVDLIKKTDETTQTVTVETEFFDFVCDGYTKFMEGNEDDADLEEAFINKVLLLQSKDAEEIESRKKEAQFIENELENIKSKSIDFSKLESKKKKINEDLNNLIANDKQLESLKAKYILSIENTLEEVGHLDSQIEELLKTKTELANLIGSQTINPQDIKEMNLEKVEMLRELERLKPERESKAKHLKGVERVLLEKLDKIEEQANEIRCIKGGIILKSDSGVEAGLFHELEGELASKKETLVNFEMNKSTLEDKIADKALLFKDFEEQYSHMNSKLQTIGSIYLEKKEISERAQQKNRNEMDKLENELLKLKLESDSLLLKTEKDHSESKIKLDILNSNISREEDEINRVIWDFYHNAEGILKGLDSCEKEMRKMAN